MWLIDVVNGCGQWLQLVDVDSGCGQWMWLVDVAEAMAEAVAQGFAKASYEYACFHGDQSASINLTRPQALFFTPVSSYLCSNEVTAS